MNAQNTEQGSQTTGGDSHPGLLALLDDTSAAMSLIRMPRIGADPPTEFRAFRYGDNATTKGTLKLTKEGVAKAMATYQNRSVVKCFDLWHSTYAPTGTVAPQDRFAVGHFKLEARADGVWYADIQWVPQYAQEIRDGKWPFISPAVLHDKDGVIFDFKNAGLVTDPGLIGVPPTILSGAEAGFKGHIPMADKKRMVLDAYAANERAMKCNQALADTDGAEKELGNMGAACMAPMMDKFRSHMGQSGYMGDVTLSAKSEADKVALLSALERETGETDPEKIQGKIMARMLSAVTPTPLPGTHLNEADTKAAKKLLMDGHSRRYPAARRDSLESMPLGALLTYLSNAPEITPNEATPAREAAPMAPTVANLEAAAKTVPTPKLPQPGDASKPTTLAACTPTQRALIEGQIAMSRQIMGDKFDESAEVQAALATLSDLKPVEGLEIRRLPYNVDGVVTLSAGGE